VLIKLFRPNKIISIKFWSELFDVVGCSTGEIFNVSAFKVEIWEYDNFLFIELTEIFRYYHVVMRICVFKLYDIVVSAEVVRYFALERGTCKSSPKKFLSLDHSFIRFGYSTVQIQ